MLSPTSTKGQMKEDKRLEDKRLEDKRIEDNGQETKLVLMSPASHTLTQAITIKTTSPARWDSMPFFVNTKFTFCTKLD
jgi:hypothetical protein